MLRRTHEDHRDLRTRLLAAHTCICCIEARQLMTTIDQSKLPDLLSWFATSAGIARPRSHVGSTDRTARICKGASQRRSHRTVTITNTAASVAFPSAKSQSTTIAATSHSRARGPRFSATKFLRRLPQRNRVVLSVAHGAAETSLLCDMEGMAQQSHSLSVDDEDMRWRRLRRRLRLQVANFHFRPLSSLFFKIAFGTY